MPLLIPLLHRDGVATCSARSVNASNGWNRPTCQGPGRIVMQPQQEKNPGFTIVVCFADFHGIPLWLENSIYDCAPYFLVVPI